MAYSRLALAHLQARIFFWGGFLDGWIVGGRSSCKKGAYITLLLGRNGVSEESEEPSLEDESVDSVGIGIGWFADLFVFFWGGWVEVARKFWYEYDVRRVRVEEGVLVHSLLFEAFVGSAVSLIKYSAFLGAEEILLLVDLG